MSPRSPQPAVLVHVDMDSLWALLQAYGDSAYTSESETPDPVFTTAMRRFIDLFSAYNIPASFFVCGRDCLPLEHTQLIREAAQNGHEIASHSHSHKIGFSDQGRDIVIDELNKSSQAIHEACGIRPIGFRMPGFGINETVIDCLIEKGFRYDSSLLPSSINPVMRLASKFIGASGPSGNKRYGVNAIHKKTTEPCRLFTRQSSESSSTLLELPVSVSPLLRLPLHASVAMAAGWGYTNLGLKRLLKHRSVIVYLFHAIDLIGASEVNGLPSGFLGRRLFPESQEKKARFVRRILDFLTRSGKVIKTTEWIDVNNL